MGGALATAVSKCKKAEIYLADYSDEKAQALASRIGAGVSTNNEIARACKFIFMGVKPGVIRGVLADISDGLSANSDAVIVTMAAGVDISTVDCAAGGGKRIIRIMPNTPVAVGSGMITYCTSNLSEGDEENFLTIMENAGKLDKISEGVIDSASALSGCGPAFVYMFCEALADGAVLCGLPRDKALLYAAETIKGASEMILKTGKHPGQLKDEVCSPGGSTIEGVCALENGAFRSLAAEAVIAAYEKTKKLGK